MSTPSIMILHTLFTQSFSHSCHLYFLKILFLLFYIFAFTAIYTVNCDSQKKIRSFFFELLFFSIIQFSSFSLILLCLPSFLLLYFSIFLSFSIYFLLSFFISFFPAEEMNKSLQKIAINFKIVSHDIL